MFRNFVGTVGLSLLRGLGRATAITKRGAARIDTKPIDIFVVAQEHTNTTQHVHGTDRPKASGKSINPAVRVPGSQEGAA